MEPILNSDLNKVGGKKILMAFAFYQPVRPSDTLKHSDATTVFVQGSDTQIKITSDSIDGSSIVQYRSPMNAVYNKNA